MQPILSRRLQPYLGSTPPNYMVPLIPLVIKRHGQFSNKPLPGILCPLHIIELVQKNTPMHEDSPRHRLSLP